VESWRGEMMPRRLESAGVGTRSKQQHRISDRLGKDMRWVMDEKDVKEEKMPVITILERRSERQAELSSADIMRILRKRAARNAWKHGSEGYQPKG
jgi:hypothetical protein